MTCDKVVGSVLAYLYIYISNTEHSTSGTVTLVWPEIYLWDFVKWIWQLNVSLFSCFFPQNESMTPKQNPPYCPRKLTPGRSQFSKEFQQHETEGSRLWQQGLFLLLSNYIWFSCTVREDDNECTRNLKYFWQLCSLPFLGTLAMLTLKAEW